MVVGINDQARPNKCFDQTLVSPDVLTHAVGDLNDTAPGFTIIPPGTHNLQTVRAGELEFVEDHDLVKFAQATERWLVAQYRSRKVRLRTLPAPFLGKSVSEKQMRRGIL
jgi:hypothetical protein